MIVAVEGPSAAGKTTWCERQPWPTVAEYAPTGHEPDDADADRQVAYWVRVNCDRWRQSLGLERDHQIVLCDSDPLKLHYSWCLARIGAAPWSRFERELISTRAALSSGELGFADRILVSIPPLEVLRSRRASDSDRRRRSFELHVQLSEPLREWYSAVECAEPGRVSWSWPPIGVSMVAELAARCDPTLLDRVVEHLPACGASGE